jgi:hypothetical protein
MDVALRESVGQLRAAARLLAITPRLGTAARRMGWQFPTGDERFRQTAPHIRAALCEQANQKRRLAVYVVNRSCSRRRRRPGAPVRSQGAGPKSNFRLLRVDLAN